MILFTENVVFSDISSKTANNGETFYHGYITVVGTRSSMYVNVPDVLLHDIPENKPCDVKLNYRFSTVTKNDSKAFYHNFDVMQILPRS